MDIRDGMDDIGEQKDICDDLNTRNLNTSDIEYS